MICSWKDPPKKSTFEDFSQYLLHKIEQPSQHSITVKFDSKESSFVVAAHGNNKSSMSQLVMDNICKTLVYAHARYEKKKQGQRRRGKVVRTRRGNDAIVKVAQMNKQHLYNIGVQDANKERSKQTLQTSTERVPQFHKHPIIQQLMGRQWVHRFHSSTAYKSISCSPSENIQYER